LFYLDNNGYVSIKQTQDAFFNGRYVGSDAKSGVSFPDITRIAKAYGIDTVVIDNHDNMQDCIRKALEGDTACICEVKLLSNYKFEPKLSSERKPDGRLVSKPLEDLFPFLSREEFKKNMIIPVLDEDK
jgi:acetolactate synthase-1/2/3 large subunit